MPADQPELADAADGCHVESNAPCSCELALGNVAAAQRPVPSRAPAEKEVEQEAKRLWEVRRALWGGPGWADAPVADRAGTYTLARDSLKRRAAAVREAYLRCAKEMEAWAGHETLCHDGWGRSSLLKLAEWARGQAERE